MTIPKIKIRKKEKLSKEKNPGAQRYLNSKPIPTKSQEKKRH